mgnify:CR=1 FL=1
MKCTRCGAKLGSSLKIQTCKKCNKIIYPIHDKDVLKETDLQFQESRKRRRVRKLDFEIR